MQELPQLLRRLERLEGQNRRLKFLGIGCLLVIGLFASMGAQDAKPEVLDEIRVKKLVIMDDHDRERLVLTGDLAWEIREHNWTSRRRAPTKMIHRSEGFCFLNMVQGAFEGGGEQVRRRRRRPS